MVNADELPLESHPFPPFLPPNSKVLIMGTFPPPAKRWSMNFYYPNRTNDFWYMMGLLFFGDRESLRIAGTKDFDLPKIQALLCDKGIALNDTGRIVRRLKGNASDKFLEILEPIPLKEVLAEIPDCRVLATTGEKAAQVLAELTNTEPPKMGEMVMSPDGLQIWRMPSTSRAYPLPLAEKAAYYRRLFIAAGIMSEI